MAWAVGCRTWKQTVVELWPLVKRTGKKQKNKNREKKTRIYTEKRAQFHYGYAAGSVTYSSMALGLVCVCVCVPQCVQLRQNIFAQKGIANATCAGNAEFVWQAH